MVSIRQSVRGKRLWQVVRLLVTAGLIAFVLDQAGLFEAEGRAGFVRMLAGVDLFYLFISFLVSVLMNLVSSYKWYVLLCSRQIHVTLSRLFALYYVGKFFNLFLPTGMGGDVARVYELGRITGTNTESLASVFVERFTGMITLTAVSAVAVLISLREYDIPVITTSLLLCVLITTVVTWMILDTRPLTWFSRLATGRIAALSGLFGKLHKVHGAIRAYKDRPGTLWYAFVISVVFYFLAVINVWVSALAFSREVEFLTILVAVPAIMLIMNLPISIGGLGLMEAAYTIIFTAFGYSSSLALSTALLIRLKTLVDGVIGGLFYLARGERPART